MSANLEVKIAKEMYKKIKSNTVVFRQQRDEIIACFVKSPVPNWGSIKFTILN